MKRACKNALILVLAAFAVACTGNVNGRFFQDLNNNGKLDLGENLANDVNFTVKKDGKEIYTGNGPTFSFHAEKGVYCVTINNRQDEEPVNPFLNRQLGSKQLGAASDEAAPVDSNDSNAVAPAQASEDSTDLAAEAEANGDGDKCVEKKNFAGDLEFEMPVAVNYMAQLTRIPQGQPCKLKPGGAESTCVVEIRYPCGCQLKDLFVPSDVMSVVPGQGRNRHEFDENLGSVSFAQSAGGNAGDEVCSTQMTLQAHPDVEPGTYPFKLQPEAKCPDKTYNLREIPVELTSKVELRLEQQMLGSPGAGDTMRVNMTLNNNGHTAVKNCEISCAYPDDVVASDRASRDCDGRFSNHPAVCACDMLAGESGKSFKVQYTLPEDVPNLRNIEFRCTVTADNLEEVVSSKLELRLTPPVE